MDIKYLLKIGKRKNISSIQKGQVWMSTPECLRPLEASLVKGQGDKLEGGMHITASKMWLTDRITGHSLSRDGEINLDVLMDPVKTVPIYCLFSVYEKDVENGRIKLNLQTQDTIREHFPEADAVAVIKYPEEFIKEFETTIHDEGESAMLGCKHGEVQYFDMYGVGDKKAIDGRFIEFITGGRKPEKTSKRQMIPIYEDDSWRHLFCKDVFFQGEQEYRFILPKVTVDRGKLFEIKLSEKIEIFDLEEFFSEMEA